MYYLNTDTAYVLFEKALNSEIYVDKSLMIEEISSKINTGDNCICITRPRRFGKTMNANMLGAFYTKGMDSRSLFANLAIAGTAPYEKDMNQYHVFYIDFSRRPDFCPDYETYLTSILKKIRKDLETAYPSLQSEEYDGVSEMLCATGESFIFILDEWDSVFYEEYMGDKEKSHYLKFLKGLLKDQPYVALAYMTGVLPIVKYSSVSELNMFAEYNFINDNVFDRYFGFREDEVRRLCEEHQTVSFEEIKQWYDGYYASDGTSLFNPYSVNMTLARGVCLKYFQSIKKAG